MAAIMKNLAYGFYWIYVLIIYGEIFTSVIGNVYGIEKQLNHYVKLPSMIWVSIIFAISYIGSFVNYGTLLSYLYPVFGYVTIIFIVLLWMKPLDSVKK
jgi:uncharacterized membrane protein YkvI